MSRKLACIVALVALVAIQCFGPARTNPPTDEAQTLSRVATVPPEGSTILARACNDCHSNETRWPWYAYIAPVSWFTVGHVHDGRAELNFSEWGRYQEWKKETRLRAIATQCEAGTMLLPSYLLLHRDAALSPLDVQAVTEWAAAEGARVKGAGFDPGRDAAKDVEDAVARARPEGKRVLLEVGENACGWCRDLSALLDSSADAAEILRRSYVVVKVNMSTENPNRELLSRYPEIPGYPHLFVLDGSGALLESQRTRLLHEGDHHDPAKVIAFLEKWEPER